jgi:lipid-A-disaccharide synthase
MIGADLDVALVVGEHSGDHLGAALMQALRAATEGRVRFRGVAGPRMQAAGMASQFPLDEIAVMGVTAVVPRLPRILRRIRETAEGLVAAPPDVLVIIDSPDFTHRVAARVRKRLPHLPIVDYVSPSVWAWRPGRARKMAAYVDHLLAILPFEPAVHAGLGGPPTTYVGHPLIERLNELRGPSGGAAAANDVPPLVLAMPGSRAVTVSRLLPLFGAALARAHAAAGPFEVAIPALDHLHEAIAMGTADWRMRPRILTGEAAKLAAFRQARAALVCSGTATLELALAGVPMVVAYRLSALEARLIRLVRVPSIVLPNLILGDNAIPEFVHHAATDEALGAALAALLPEGVSRQAQCLALTRLDALMSIGAETPSGRAARIVLELVAARRA